MKRKNKIDPYKAKLDKEEKEILKSFEKGEWKTVSNLQEEIAFAKTAAANYLRKDARIHLKVSGTDLVRIKELAAYEGLPYQAFAASVLHKYAAGHLHE